MNSLTDLREVVDVVIGVDTHVHTHSAAVVDAGTGGVLDEITLEATAEGYAELVEFANNHPMAGFGAGDGAVDFGALLGSAAVLGQRSAAAWYRSWRGPDQLAARRGLGRRAV